MEAYCLINWLNSQDYSEIMVQWRKFAKEASVSVCDCITESDVKNGIEKWIKGNKTPQFLYIGSHGTKPSEKTRGLGPNHDFMSWVDLGDLLSSSINHGDHDDAPIVWIGACYSSIVADDLSGIYPIDKSPPAKVLTTFATSIAPSECEELLKQYLNVTNITKIISLEDEMEYFRDNAKGLCVQQYYAIKKNGFYEYIEVREFPKEMNMTFKEYLDQESVNRFK